MGVPAFFKWLTIRYPQVVIDALCEEDLEFYYSEFKKEQADEAEIALKRKIDENNPKVDNLYLDMNGIIHPCCHPLDRP